jgi:predicted outer membrane lipoprotein
MHLARQKSTFSIFQFGKWLLTIFLASPFDFLSAMKLSRMSKERKGKEKNDKLHNLPLFRKTHLKIGK